MKLAAIQKHLTTHTIANLETLFVELGWDRPPAQSIATPTGVDTLTPLAQKRGYMVFVAQCATMPDKSRRNTIEQAIYKQRPNKLIIFVAGTQRIWQFSTRDAQRKRALREFAEPGDTTLLAGFLARMEFGLDQEETLTLVDVLQLLNPLAEVEKVTKKFYEEFKRQHDVFMNFIAGIPDEQMQRWYASVMLNRLMFIYFLQKKQFVAGDVDYLKKNLDKYPQNYYQEFLCPLFFDGFAKKPAERSPEAKAKLGNVPYLNGGIFNQHQIEQLHGQKITIADEAFQKIFTFFDGWTWHLDDRPLKANSNEINPDVLGYIFEKYINQRQMGAYYTKEDITEYICRSTIVPFLLDIVVTDADWQLLADDPERYIFAAVRHGLELPLPAHIAAGITDVSKRSSWNTQADEAYKLPTEIWRETVARRQRAEQLIARMKAGEVRTSNQLITDNLDVRQFLQDVIARATAAQVMTLWHRVQTLSVLDPTVGSGAFLFAALNILKPIYDACLDRMAVLRADGQLADHTAAVEAVLRDINTHKSQTYTVLKRIMINNLYGVDIMEEAVEICKLRLFLKLTAQISDLQHLEPLPDIDFNIRAGNTLVGYARLKDAQTTAVNTNIDMDLFGTKDVLREKLEALARVAKTYRQQQGDMGSTYADKQALTAQLAETAEALNQRLAAIYGIDVRNKAAYAKWLTSHEPFHWCSEFYEIVEERGGFDVIVGNPPYVARSTIRSLYRLYSYDTDACPDIYANVMERCTEIIASNSARFGVIVPLNLMFSGDFASLRLVLRDSFTANWFSAYDIWPAGLFAGVGQRCTIVLSSKSGMNQNCTSMLHRWVTVSRPVLFEKLTYQILHHDMLNEIPRMRMTTLPRWTVSNIGRMRDVNEYKLYFPTAANLFTPFSLFDMPTLNSVNYEELERQMIANISFSSKSDMMVNYGACSGDIHFAYWLTHGDAFHVTKGLVTRYTVALHNVLRADHKDILSKIGSNLALRHREALFISKYNNMYIGSFYWGKFKAITRRADMVISAAYGMTLFEYDELMGSVDISRAASNVAMQRNIPDQVVSRYYQIIDTKMRDLGIQSYSWEEIDTEIANLVGVNVHELNLICGNLE